MRVFSLTGVIIAPLFVALSAQDRQTSFHGGVEAVQVTVSVMRHGVPVRGLSADDFLVRDDNVPQSIQSVILENAPLNVVMVLDTSGSVNGSKLSELIAAGTAVANALHEDDRAALVTFADDVVRRVALAENNRQQILQALRTLQGRGPTALRDGIFAALQLKSDEERTTVLMVFTDGQDTASWLREQDLLEAVRRAYSVVHVIEVGETVLPLQDDRPRLSPNSGPSLRAGNGAASGFRAPQSPFSETAARSAGGQYWRIGTVKDLPAVFIRALNEVRARYQLTFYPAVPNRPGWHSLNVRLRNGTASIVNRAGYFVDAPSR